MELRDRTTAEAVAQIATLLAQAYQHYRRIERTRPVGRETANGELENVRLESLPSHVVDA